VTALHAVILPPEPAVIPRACPGYETPCGLPRLFADSRWLYNGQDYVEGEWASRCDRGHVFIHPGSEMFGDEG
jgi:hypothetical protein